MKHMILKPKALGFHRARLIPCIPATIVCHSLACKRFA
jgi:hypothetical protein